MPQQGMKASKACRDLIQRFEECRLVAYPDPGTNAAPWTIGWGATGKVTKDDGSVVTIGPGMTCTQAEADRWFNERLAYFESGVDRLVKRDISQPMFDALVSFAYNCGLDENRNGIAEGLGDSSLLKYVNSGEWLLAAKEFLKWIKSGGRVLNGLVRRREAEQALFLSGIMRKSA